MRLDEIADAEERVEDRHRKWWTNEELDPLFNVVKKSTLSKEETQDLAREVKERFKLNRTETGVYQVLIQLHMVIHGVFPDGIIVYPGNWQHVTDNMVKYARSKGLDVEERIKAARTDMEKRIKRHQSKVKEPIAREMMANYYKENKNWLPPAKDMSKHRDSIIKMIMNGTSPEEAYSHFI